MPKPSEEVVTRVAEAEGCSPSELPPLYEVIDPGALDELFTSPPRDPEQAADEVRFDYVDYEVIISGAAEVALET